MKNILPTQLASKAAIAAAMLAFSAAGFAESGQDIYKANCQSCHGPTGTPSAGMAKMMGVKAAAEYKTSADEQFNSVKNGKNKMKPFAGKLSDAQIKDAIAYFRTLK
jgi:mono/diheme cytochrome c family protein